MSELFYKVLGILLAAIISTSAVTTIENSISWEDDGQDWLYDDGSDGYDWGDGGGEDSLYLDYDQTDSGDVGNTGGLSEDEQSEKFKDGILDVNAYGFNVDRENTVGPGPDDIMWSMWFPETKTVMEVDVRLTQAGSAGFMENWEQTKVDIEDSGRKFLGDDLKEITFWLEPLDDGQTFPVIYFVYQREEVTYQVTVCYRFCDTYTAEFISIDDRSGDDQTKLVLDAAKSFTDMGGDGHMYYGPANMELGRQDWDFYYLHNPFAVASYYMDIDSPKDATPERKETDYEIVWKDPVFEKMVREALGRQEGPVMSSDLDLTEELWIQEDYSGSYYTATINKQEVTVWKDEGTLLNVENIRDFKNLTSIRLEIDTLTDLSPLDSQSNVTDLFLLVSPDLDTVGWLAYMPKLEHLMMWGEFYEKVPDIEAMQYLTELQSAELIFPSVTDVTPLKDLPKLESLMLYCSEEADVQCLKDAQQIESLFVNGEDVR